MRYGIIVTFMTLCGISNALQVNLLTDPSFEAAAVPASQPDATGSSAWLSVDENAPNNVITETDTNRVHSQNQAIKFAAYADQCAVVQNTNATVKVARDYETSIWMLTSEQSTHANHTRAPTLAVEMWTSSTQGSGYAYAATLLASQRNSMLDVWEKFRGVIRGSALAGHDGKFIQLRFVKENADVSHRIWIDDAALFDLEVFAETGSYQLYVDQNHPAASDGNDGLLPTTPVVTLGRALQLAQTYMNAGASVTIKMAAGIYRESNVVSATDGSALQHAHLTIEGDPAGGTKIYGTMDSAASGFLPATWTLVPGQTRIYQHPWTFRYGVANTHLAKLSEITDAGSEIYRREMLFADEIMLKPRALEIYNDAAVYQGEAANGLGVLNADWTFAVADHPSSTTYGGKIYMRVPNGFNLNTLGAIEPSRKLAGLGIRKCEVLLSFEKKHHVTLRHLSLKRAGSHGGTGNALYFWYCDDIVLEDLDVSYNNAGGVLFEVDDTVTLRRCKVNWNGRKGLQRQIYNALLVDSEFNYNSWIHKDVGGIKIAYESQNVLFKRCIAMFNNGCGIWSDFCRNKLRWEQCFLYGNSMVGLLSEIPWVGADDPTITYPTEAWFGPSAQDTHGHVMFRNVVAYNKDNGIRISNSERTTVDECLMINNGVYEYLSVFGDRAPWARTAAQYEWQRITRCHMYTQSTASALGGAGRRYGIHFTGLGNPVPMMHYSGNHYYSSVASPFLAAGISNKDFAGWKAHLAGVITDPTGRDTTSTFTTIPSTKYYFHPGEAISKLAESWGVPIPYEIYWPGKGVYTSSEDVGSPERPGRAGESSGKYVVVGGGAGLAGGSDAFQYLSKSWSGNCDIIAKVDDVENTGTGARAGLMLRETSSAGAKYAAIMVTAGGTAVFSSRTLDDQTATTSSLAGFSAPCWLRLIRSGNRLTGYVSTNGSDWQSVGTITMAMPSGLRLGMLATSQDDFESCTALFSGVQISGTPAATSPYDQWALGYGLAGSDAWNSADHDSDGMNNLVEYALGGNPTHADATTKLPTIAVIADAGADWLEYVYRRRNDAGARGLVYTVQTSTHLDSSGWNTDGVIPIRSVPVDAGFDAVTLRISASAVPSRFVRLKIEQR